MAEAPRDFTLERINRLSQAVGDLMEGQAAQGRMFTKYFERMEKRFDQVDTRFAQADARFDQVDARLGEVGTELRKLNGALSKLLATPSLTPPVP